MKITKINNLSEVEHRECPCDVTIGFFDGVHLGHKALINTLEKSSNKKVIITFEHHPTKSNLMSLDEKIYLLSKFDVDELIVISLLGSNQKVTAEQFIEFLKKICVKTISVGADFRFGFKASGDVSMLEQNFKVNICEFAKIDGEKISSMKIREALSAGNIDLCNSLLGRDYQITGKVVQGDQIGRTINFPTANIESEIYLPSNGVYATITLIENKIYNSVTNIGRRPTVNGTEDRIETHILDFNEDLYGKKITVMFKKKLRNEQKFSSLEELKKAITNDIEKVEDYYGN